MKRFFFIVILGIIININIFAGGTMIIVEYKHSRRVQCNEIVIELGAENNNNGIFYGILRTRDRVFSDDLPFIERKIGIEKEYFDVIYNRILDLSFKEIVKTNENRVTTDGTTISVTVGTRQNNIKMTLNSPNSMSTETDEFCMILYKLFSLFGMEEWL